MADVRLRLQLQPRIFSQQISRPPGVARSPRFYTSHRTRTTSRSSVQSERGGAKSGDGGAAMRHTMGCKLGARAEIFARRSGAASITSAAKARSWSRRRQSGTPTRPKPIGCGRSSSRAS